MTGKKILLKIPCTAALLLLLFTACKKEYVPASYTDIQAFSVATPDGGTLEAVITGDTILLYWPPGLNFPDSITPKISVSQGASVNPASGKTTPVSQGMAFIVTAQNGDKKEYVLRLVSNSGFTAAIRGSYYPGGIIYIEGQGFNTDTNTTGIYLIDTIRNKETKLPLIGISSIGTAANLSTDGSIDTGYYNIKFVSGLDTAIFHSIHLGVPPLTSVGPTFSIEDTYRTVQLGENVVLNYSFPAAFYQFYKAGKFSQVFFIQIGNQYYYSLPIIGQTDNTVTFKIPADATTGVLPTTNSGLYLVYTDGNGTDNYVNVVLDTDITIVSN